MPVNHASFTGWRGGVRAAGAEQIPRRDADITRQFELLLRVLTPTTVFMEIGSADAELSLRCATYVERVWCVDPQARLARAAFNLRVAGMGIVPPGSVDVAFSERLADLEGVLRVLACGGVYFIYGHILPSQLFREAGFSRVQYFAGSLKVPGALARISRTSTTAAYK